MNKKVFNFSMIVVLGACLFIFANKQAVLVKADSVRMPFDENSFIKNKMKEFSVYKKNNSIRGEVLESEDEILKQMKELSDEYKKLSDRELRSEIAYVANILRQSSNKNHEDFDSSDLKNYNLQVRKKVILQRILFDRKYSELNSLKELL